MPIQQSDNMKFCVYVCRTSKFVSDYVHNCFQQVNTKAAGKAAIHCACAAGSVDVLKVIMEFKPNLELGVGLWGFDNFKFGGRLDITSLYACLV